jgi:hypothetical protein
MAFFDKLGKFGLGAAQGIAAELPNAMARGEARNVRQGRLDAAAKQKEEEDLRQVFELNNQRGIAQAKAKGLNQLAAQFEQEARAKAETNVQDTGNELELAAEKFRVATKGVQDETATTGMIEQKTAGANLAPIKANQALDQLKATGADGDFDIKRHHDRIESFGLAQQGLSDAAAARISKDKEEDNKKTALEAIEDGLSKRTTDFTDAELAIIPAQALPAYNARIKQNRVDSLIEVLKDPGILEHNPEVFNGLAKLSPHFEMARSYMTKEPKQDAIQRISNHIEQYHKTGNPQWIELAKSEAIKNFKGAALAGHEAAIKLHAASGGKPALEKQRAIEKFIFGYMKQQSEDKLTKTVKKNINGFIIEQEVPLDMGEALDRMREELLPMLNDLGMIPGKITGFAPSQADELRQRNQSIAQTVGVLKQLMKAGNKEEVVKRIRKAKTKDGLSDVFLAIQADPALIAYYNEAIREEVSDSLQTVQPDMGNVIKSSLFKGVTVPDTVGVNR